MAFVEGTTITGHDGELVVIAPSFPTSNGGSNSAIFNGRDSIAAYAERNTTDAGSTVQIYDPELSSILGGEFG